jgi:uncharacterized protein (TIGR04255 family)
MTETRPPLPDFTNPPVVEVALSVQYARLERLRVAQIGQLWGEFKDMFPKTEEHAPLAPAWEKFEPALPRVEIKVETSDVLPVPRVWFVNDEESELIQVQQDRFAHNWRKRGESDKYPRYEKIRESFKSELEKFRQFLLRENLGEITPDQAEVTYVNHISPNEAWENHSQVGEVVTVWTDHYSDNFLSNPEDVSFRARFRIRGADDKPLGRLHVVLQPAFSRTDQQPIFVLTLTARGEPLGSGIDAAMNFMDLGREWIVRGFTSITTQRMHQIWGRCDAEQPDRN